MEYTKKDTQALIEREACEGDTFGCPYCPKVFETRKERDRCQASHFQDTDSISKPRSDRTRHRNKNIVNDWKSEVEN